MRAGAPHWRPAGRFGPAWRTAHMQVRVWPLRVNELVGAATPHVQHGALMWLVAAGRQREQATAGRRFRRPAAPLFNHSVMKLVPSAKPWVPVLIRPVSPEWCRYLLFRASLAAILSCPTLWVCNQLVNQP